MLRLTMLVVFTLLGLSAQDEKKPSFRCLDGKAFFWPGQEDPTPGREREAANFCRDLRDQLESVSHGQVVDSSSIGKTDTEDNLDKIRRQRCREATSVETRRGCGGIRARLDLLRSMHRDCTGEERASLTCKNLVPLSEGEEVTVLTITSELPGMVRSGQLKNKEGQIDGILKGSKIEKPFDRMEFVDFAPGVVHTLTIEVTLRGTLQFRIPAIPRPQVTKLTLKSTSCTIPALYYSDGRRILPQGTTVPATCK